jgi:hypothetical protein
MSDKVYDALTLLAACLCEEASDQGQIDLCFCGIAPGEQVAHDYGFPENCDGVGMAWVRLIGSYAATIPGQLDPSPGNCGKQTGMDIEVGILRPYYISAEGITAEVAEPAVVGQFSDMAKMRRAILCCDAFKTKEIVLGPYSPVGPTGGIFGGIQTFSAVV